MTNSPYFSIVIPTFNRASHILRAIESALQQEYDGFEVIVVDDGSTDNTREIVSSVLDPRVSYHRTENRERAAARNFGAGLAHGTYVNFLDSDDALLAQHLSTAFRFAESESRPPVFSLHFMILDETLRKRKAPKVYDVRKQLLRGNYLSCSGVFVRTDVIRENPFNERRDLAALEDWELWIRLAARYDFPHLNAATSLLMVHPDRSVLTTNTRDIEKKVEAFMASIQADQVVLNAYGTGIRKPLASALSYASLHLAMSRADTLLVLRYYWSAVHMYSLEIFRRRTLAILRLIFRNLVTKA